MQSIKEEGKPPYKRWYMVTYMLLIKYKAVIHTDALNGTIVTVLI